MAKTSIGDKPRKMRPALTLEARENQLISLAIDLAEEQLRNGTASTAVITHYLRLGSLEEKRKMEKLEHENELLRAKTNAIESAARSEELYAQVISAMRSYAGLGEDGDGEDTDVW